MTAHLLHPRSLAFPARSLVVGLIAILALVGCEPRGETHTLQQVLDDARASFRTVGKNPPADAVKATVSTLTESMEALVKLSGEQGSQEAVAKSAVGIAEAIDGLLPKAGMTARAGLAELAMQYRVIAADAPKNAVSQPAVKLLVARTYSALASELESTRFGI